MVRLVAGPYRSSRVSPGGGVNATVTVTSPGPTSTARRSGSRVSRCAADSTTTSSSPTTTAPDGSARLRASVSTVRVTGS